jgi:hypothetical protein
LFANCPVSLGAKVAANVARYPLEVADRLASLAFRLLALIAGRLAFDLFCFAANLIFHI